MPVHILMLFIAALALIAPSSATAARCRALDGDTLLCDQRKIRLTNVYAAELNEAGGREARRRLQSLASSGDITWRSFGIDRYGRTLAEVYVDGRRIEQSDIGPRAGRGVHAGAARHHAAPRRPRAAGARPPGVARQPAGKAR
jgi:hypothetical protein